MKKILSLIFLPVWFQTTLALPSGLNPSPAGDPDGIVPSGCQQVSVTENGQIVPSLYCSESSGQSTSTVVPTMPSSVIEAIAAISPFTVDGDIDEDADQLSVESSTTKWIETPSVMSFETTTIIETSGSTPVTTEVATVTQDAQIEGATMPEIEAVKRAATPTIASCALYSFASLPFSFSSFPTLEPTTKPVAKATATTLIPHTSSAPAASAIATYTCEVKVKLFKNKYEITGMNWNLPTKLWKDAVTSANICGRLLKRLGPGGHGCSPTNHECTALDLPGGGWNFTAHGNTPLETRKNCIQPALKDLGAPEDDCEGSGQ